MSETARVAVMEIRTAVYRACVAEGASSGEAEAAGAAAARAEVLVGGGVRLALQGLGAIPRERIGARVEDGEVARLVDPAGRAPLLRIRMALDWLGATGRAIVVPDLAWADALVGALPPGVAAIGPDRGAACPDGGVALFDGTGGIDAEPVHGVLLLRAEPTAARARIHREEADRRLADAGATGVVVDARDWALLDAAAARYLVPEA